MSTIGNWRGPNIIKEGLVLYLDPGSPNSFYNKSGTIIKDISGNGNNGILTNFGSQTIYNSGSGGSIVFDGTNDYIDNIGSVDTFSFIQNTGIYTISVWLKLNLTTKEMYVMGNNNGTTNLKGFWLGTNGVSNSVQLVITLGLGAVFTLIHTITNFFVTDTWVNVTCVGNGVNNKIYKNGILLGTSNFSTLSNGNSSNTLSIGRINSADLWYWNGNVAQSLIYNKALSPSEILQNYNVLKSRFGL